MDDRVAAGGNGCRDRKMGRAWHLVRPNGRTDGGELGKNAKRVIFLDRNGVINPDADGYVQRVSAFPFPPGSLVPPF